MRWLVLALLLAGCTRGYDAVRLACADVYNAGGKTCQEPSVYLARPRIVHGGTVSRARAIVVEMVIVNGGASARHAYVAMKFDADCKASGAWPFARRRWFLAGDSSNSISVKLRCEDMPLGEHSLTATLWDDAADDAQSPVLDRWVVRFTLVE